MNENYKPSENTSKYCIVRENGAPNSATTNSTESPTSTTKPITTKAPEVTTTATTTLAPKIPETTTKKVIVTTQAPSTKSPVTPPTTPHQPSTHATPTEKNEVMIKPAPGQGHFWSGILIPLTIVAAFMGGVFMIRKYDLLDRAYNRIRNRNTPVQRYNGLMENDFDDDPLLI